MSCDSLTPPAARVERIITGKLRLDVSSVRSALDAGELDQASTDKPFGNLDIALASARRVK